MLRNFFTKTSLVFLTAASVFLANNAPAQAQKDILEREQSVEYTLMPMFLPKAPGSLIYEDLLWAMTRDQGYEAHCASLEWYLDKDLYGQISKFFSQETPPVQSFYRGLNPTIFEGEDDVYAVDVSRSRIAMMRGLDSRADLRKNSSLEGMFGVNQPLSTDNYSLNASGVSENLLTSYQQCLAKSQNILASAQICDENPVGKCTINKEWSFNIIYNKENGTSRKITDPKPLDQLRRDENGEEIEQVVKVAFWTNNLRDWFANIRPDLHGKELYEQVCYDLTVDLNKADENYDPPKVDPVEIAKLREAMSVVAIDLDSLYRLAFLVISPQQNKGKEDENDKFHWLQAESIGQIDSEAHAPIFVAFKIPDFGTNKSRIAGNIDSLELTKMVLQTKEQNDKDLLDQTKRREKIYEAAKRASELTDGEKVMNCPSFYPQCKRSGQNALNNVIEDIINGIRLRCHNDTLRIIEKTIDENGEPISVGGLSFNEKQAVASGIELIFNQEDLHWEQAGDLFTPANKDIREINHASPINTHVGTWQSSTQANKNFPQGLFDWKLIIDEDPPDLEGPMKVNAYLVLPVGESIKDANKALSIFWREEDFFEMIKNNVIEDMKTESGKSVQGAIPKHYPIRDTEIGFVANDQINPLDEYVTEQRVNPQTGQIYNVRLWKRYPFGVAFSDNHGEMLFPDFGLGFMVRKIQQVLRTTYDASYNYIKSCQRVEDMFLGRCSGDPEGEEETKSFCDGEAFKNIKGIPGANGIPEEAKRLFEGIAAMLTPELLEAYKYAEEETGIPCEVVAGIHWTEAGLNPAGSVFNGGPFSGSLKDNAKEAMEHLINYWPGKFDRNNIPYEELVAAIGIFNGPGNMNCSSDPEGNIRPTRWREGGKCPAQFQSEDHPHAVAWIDGRHDNMDLIYCMDFAEFSCQTSGTDEELNDIKDHIRDFMSNAKEDVRWSEERIESHAQEVKKNCFAGSEMCLTYGYGGKYPRYDRPGSLTVAILLNGAGGDY